MVFDNTDNLRYDVILKQTQQGSP